MAGSSSTPPWTGWWNSAGRGCPSPRAPPPAGGSRRAIPLGERGGRVPPPPVPLPTLEGLGCSAFASAGPAKPHLQPVNPPRAGHPGESTVIQLAPGIGSPDRTTGAQTPPARHRSQSGRERRASQGRRSRRRAALTGPSTPREFEVPVRRIWQDERLPASAGGGCLPPRSPPDRTSERGGSTWKNARAAEPRLQPLNPPRVGHPGGSTAPNRTVSCSRSDRPRHPDPSSTG
jgi:hypothetical protein